MYYLVCYDLETAVAVDDDFDPANLDSKYSKCSPNLKKFLQKVGKKPISKIDHNYPSYRAVLDNYHIIGETKNYAH
ncbi:hypothetical protein [Olivibacter sp. XZL3]|uniref:hypothetical protein n=1 Tax=Olivibacter sp. XZL3 TaxID=1735116 RepID=UPI0010657B4E|nr:hypothetical protein [Olivibacter sp. XZL3]